MKRGAGGSTDAPGPNAFQAVHDYVDRIGKREPTAEELAEIRPALEELYAKLLRLRRMSASFRKVDFSDRIWSLMKRIGKKPLPGSGSAFGRAASFL